MQYKVNPKNNGSGIFACIPQDNPVCPNNCADCFYMSGRSYLEPLKDNIPNMPPLDLVGKGVVRVNDGLDSNVEKDKVLERTKQYRQKFYNTAINNLDFPAPVVLTINPGDMTDEAFYSVIDKNAGITKPPPNLMFVRFRVNTWNLHVCDLAVSMYSWMEVPVVLTFMAYHDIESIPESHRFNYSLRTRTLNEYWAIRGGAFRMVMDRYATNKWVYSCGKTEGEGGDTHCVRCGNCMREYWNTVERMKYVPSGS